MSGDAPAWLNLTSPNSFRVLQPCDLPPTPLSPNLLSKCDSVLVMRSGVQSGEYVVANLYRRDKGNIDQMPFGTAFVGNSGSSGILTHHGDWQGRTVAGSPSPPSCYQLSQPSQTAYNQSFATLSLPSNVSGSIFDLTPKSNVDAFQRVLEELKQHSDTTSSPANAQNTMDEQTPLHRGPEHHNVSSFLILAIAAGALLLVAHVVTNRLFVAGPVNQRSKHFRESTKRPTLTGKA
jgi:hypothetical protein